MFSSMSTVSLKYFITLMEVKVCENDLGKYGSLRVLIIGYAGIKWTIEIMTVEEKGLDTGVLNLGDSKTFLLVEAEHVEKESIRSIQLTLLI